MTEQEIYDTGLPPKAREYIHQLESNADPAGMVRENMQLRDTNKGLQVMYRNRTDELEKANSNTEHLEQKCRSCGDELDAMRAENTKLHSWLTGVEQYRGHLDRVRFEAATLRTENERLRAVLKARN